ncbi:putative NF-X1 finger and helicase domain protein [Aspergillus clavatus NRRL 1]|uniref:NF-X1 finger and helicase domain protein, putative n=1 Tax=Aspergillus clavatus (strain ATCC 1007 / CBS 513.65 / DSM 816 / NCTC 3887 / NRRL 1 / QM 1276 / 107) TaxID=344612 RepID=A1CEF3_ASPCL|nr:NF-X1 finger and helicase domain protein, putative [Aspergillus clavatus NRRL 1]EAW11252.1 NF-X1 finger and helicase domain protein, putative [Aspergillus clavatus NRRL 1]
MATFFRDARTLVEVDANLMQSVINELAGEAGLRVIRELVETNFAQAGASAKSSIFASQVLPLLETISHPQVLSSLVLEQSVGTIFNVLFGINGTRAVLLLSSICDVLASSNKDEAVAGWMEVALLVFAKIVDFNSTAFVLESLKDQANRFQEGFLQLNEAGLEQSLHHARVHLEHILRRLEIGSLLPAASTNYKKKGETKPPVSFHIQRDPPGGRHDNDHVDVGKIAIMPTLAEIQSARTEYLPVNDPAQWHVGGLEGLLDRNFRLVREDTIGQLRDAIHQELRGPQRSGRRQSQMRTHVYPHARMEEVCFDKFAGLQFRVAVPQLPQVREMNAKDRENWWSLSKRLQSGALVCLTMHGHVRQTILFCTVVNEQNRSSRRMTEADKDDRKKETSLWMDPKKASLKLTLVDTGLRDVRTVLNNLLNKREFSIVEFPGILLASFEPTLRALQSIKQTGQLPFFDILVPNDDNDPVDVPPPLYALRPGFSFNLRCLMTNDADFHVRPNEPVDLESLHSHSTLDQAQAAALVHSLQHRIGLIQGPPGTGKSFTGVALIRVLLANRKKNHHEKTDIGPVLCVTYTNHALDQLLEALIDKDVTSQIIRIGSQSKSDQLQPLNLRKIAKDAEKTRREREAQYHLHRELEEYEKEFATIGVNQNLLATHIILHLRQSYRHYYAQIFGESEKGWEAVRQSRPAAVLRGWINSGKPGDGTTRHFEDLQGLDLSALSRPEREAFYQALVREVTEKMHGKLTRLCSSHHKAKSMFDNVRDEGDLRCLSTADIIGVTTSGLARNLKMLRKLRSKVIICEEAGEVLEAHLLTALLPSVEHVILIGDHLQLRPQIQNYELSRENHRGGEQYSLDVSLFERLVESRATSMGLGLPFCTLETQRRMHPSIAELVRATLYPQLKDAGSVAEYPEVVGIRKRLFWLDHRNPEAGISDTQNSVMATSHWNEHELGMTIALVNHLVRQGKYRNGEIAVLTPYLGQLHRLRQLFSRAFTVTLGERDADQLETAGFEVKEDSSSEATRATLLQTLRVATIDNFQGEEAKVVVISLVRSNPQNRCGFLRTSNRINVLLSRAQHGMYIIGNSETSAHVPMWAQVLEILRQSESIGPKLELQCPRHPDTPIPVSDPEDFVQLSPEGGCNMRCINRLPCGHACEQKCHSEMLHNAVYCPQPCPRPRKGCTHSCVKRCGDQCPTKCMVDVHKEDRMLKCGHSMPTLPCWQDQDLSLVKCAVLVTKTVEHCKHEALVPCHQDVTLPRFRCTTQCSAFLPCGHTCKRQCNACLRVVDQQKSYDHGKCQQKCGRKYSTCAHFCAAACHGEQPCPPCDAPCDVRCGHSKCTKRCREPCTPCAEGECFSQCPHTACSMPCAAPCNHIPCSKRCSKTLSCGHQCPSVCGEACPSEKYCQLCGNEDLKSQVVDFIMGETYAEIDLDQNPCIFPACGHFLTMESMDGQMDIRQHYEVDEEGRPISIANASQPFSMQDIKSCATCRGPLRDIARYGRLVRRALLDESTKKFILYVNREYVPLEEELTRQVQQLQDTETRRSLTWATHDIKIDGLIQNHVKAMTKIIHQSAPGRWKKLIELRNRVLAYRKQVALDEQPYNRVRSMVENVKRRKNTDSHDQLDFDDTVLQTKGVLLASALSLRLDLALLSDFLTVKDRASNTASITITLALPQTKNECFALTNLAQESGRIPQQAEGYILLARTHALERSQTTSPAAAETHLRDGSAALDKARALCSQHPSQTRGLPAEIDGVENMLRGSTFYAVVTNEERMAVIAAMAREFHGTGHWYHCRNGHPFTIGECGGAMQESSCPECGAPVGGRDHRVVEGVRRAEDLEELLGRMQV